MSANSFANWTDGRLRELDNEAMVITSAGGGGLAGRVFDLGTDAARHAAACISNNWNKFKECYNRELNR